jgi:8-oxo-dGTP diphosphatase
MEENRPKVGVGVMIWKDGKVLIGDRTSDNGKGYYSFPGGHLEMGESVEECAIRETKEETGIEIKNIRFLNITNTPNQSRHYITIGIQADWKSGTPVVCEPDQCTGWQWYDPENLPELLWSYAVPFFTTLKTGQVFFDD